MKNKVFITITACIALAACLMTGCAAQSQATENSSSAANTSTSVSAPTKAPTAEVIFTVEAPDFTSDSSAAVAHVKKIETDVKNQNKDASERTEASSQAAKDSDSENASEASKNASDAAEKKVTHEFYHAVNRTNEDKAIELDEGTYEITWVSPINIDGAIYETPAEPQIITVKEGEPVTVSITFNKINAEDVTAEQLNSIMEQLGEAVKHGDDTLTGEAGKELVARAANNAANAPQANTEAIDEARKNAETSAMTSDPVAPSESAAAATVTNNDNASHSNDTGSTSEPATSQPSSNSGSANTSGNASDNTSSSSDSSTPTPTKQKTWVPEQGHYEDVYETVHVSAVTHEEPVYTTVVDQEAYTTYTTIFHCKDGFSTTDRDAAFNHQVEVGGNVWWENIPEEHPAVTHQEQTGTTTVVDEPARDEQRKTGTKWVVDVEGHWE